MSNLFKVLQTTLKVVCPLLVVLIPCMTFYNLISPWKVAENVLGPNQPSGAILVHFSYISGSVNGLPYARREQTYAWLSSPKTVTVIQENSGARTKEEPYGLFYTLTLYALLIAGTWWFWFRPRISRA